MVARAAVTRAIVALERLLLLHGDEARLLAEARKTVLVLAVLRNHFGIGPGLLLRLILAELLLCRGDQAEVVLGMLIVIFRGDRIAGGARITRQLHIFLGDMRCCPADLDVRSVGFENPGHRVLTTPVVIVVVVIVPVPHPLIVLTVSHIVPLDPALKIALSRNPSASILIGFGALFSLP